MEQAEVNSRHDERVCELDRMIRHWRGLQRALSPDRIIRSPDLPQRIEQLRARIAKRLADFGLAFVDERAGGGTDVG